MDYRSHILATIDGLQATGKPTTALEIQFWMGEYGDTSVKRLMRELRNMGRDGIVVYDRKGLGWRRV